MIYRAKIKATTANEQKKISRLKKEKIQDKRK